MLAPPDTVIDVDLNVRVAGGLTYSGFEDVHGQFPGIGDRCWVTEPESGMRGPAIVVRIDPQRRLIYLLVAWHLLAAAPTTKVRKR